MMFRVTLLGVLAFALTGACGKTRVAADSTSAAPARTSVAASLDPATWSDDQLSAYINLVSSTLAPALPVVQRKSRSAAVESFARTIETEQLALAHTTDSLLQGRANVVPPPVSSNALRAYEREIRRLQQEPAFDIGYVKIVEATLAEVQTQLARVDDTIRSAPVTRLLERTRRVLRNELRTAKQLRLALEPPRAPRANQSSTDAKR